MKLSEVKWRRCECGRSFPNAHYNPYVALGGNALRPGVYKRHKNMLCSPCMRADLDLLKKIDRPYEDERKRIKLLERMLP